MSIEAYMRSVVEFAIFLGVSDDRTIQPDAAVAQLEHIASFLQGLNENEREYFRSFVQQVAAKERRRQAGPLASSSYLV